MSQQQIPTSETPNRAVRAACQRHSPAYGTSKQLDAYTMLATCECGERIEQTERTIAGITYSWPWTPVHKAVSS